MSDIAIRVEGLSKRYLIGSKQEQKKLSRTLLNFAVAPVRRSMRILRGQSKSALDLEEEFWALKDVSFEVKKGEILGVVGRNGAGKSTLLKILSSITPPTEGYAEIRGQVGSLLEVGTGFHPDLTGRENIFLNGSILGLKRSEIERQFDEIVDFADIEKFIDTPVKFYSSGMYVRLAFAVAAQLQPEVLIVDEVLAVGDVAFQQKSIGKMNSVVRDEGRTILFVSHNMSTMRKLCSNMILIEKGNVIAQGPTDDVISVYLGQDAEALSPEVALPAGESDHIGRGLRLRFFSQDGTPTAQFRLDEKWRVVLEFELFKDVEHFIAGLGIVTIDGIALATYWSVPKDSHPGKFQVSFDIDLPLRACEVRFIVGLSSYERTFYYADGVGHVSISEIALGTQPLRSTGSGLLLTRQVAKVVPYSSDIGSN